MTISIDGNHDLIKFQDNSTDGHIYLYYYSGGWSVACAGFLRLGENAAPTVQLPPQRTSTAASVAPSTFGYLCSVDLLDMKPVIGTHFIRGDFRSAEVQQQIEAVGKTRGTQVRPYAFSMPFV